MKKYVKVISLVVPVVVAVLAAVGTDVQPYVDAICGKTQPEAPAPVVEADAGTK